VARRTIDPTLYLVTDRDLAGERPLDELVREALAGGATAVQLREKEVGARDFVAAGRALRQVTREAGVALIVNDRADVALAIDADGVHVGQQDLPAELARSLIGPERILGVTVGNPEEARRAEAADADYVGCNAAFATATKTDTGTPLGLDGLRLLVSSTDLPVVAIGGVNADNAATVRATGVAGIAVVSAIVGADDPRRAARELRRALAHVEG
jgi:thiamine-phosphate pyrophosphorylase